MKAKKSQSKRRVVKTNASSTKPPKLTTSQPQRSVFKPVKAATAINPRKSQSNIRVLGGRLT